MKVYIVGLIIFPVCLIFAGVFYWYPSGKLQTSPDGYSVNFRIEIYQEDILVRVCECWRYTQTAHGLKVFAEHDLELAPIWYEYGQSVEISGIREDEK